MRGPLLIPPGGFDGLRSKRQLRRLVEQCDWYRNQEPPAEHPTASITYLGYAAANLALAYKLTGQPGYLAEAERWIAAPLSYPHWGKAKMPDHDLDAGWLLFGLSLAYDWLGGDSELREKLLLQGNRLYEFALETEGRWWSSAYWQNHNWICYAGLAAAGYALERSDWTERARANFDEVFARLPADGSDAEGVVYWRYGVPWLAAYADLLRSAEGVDAFQSCDFLRNTFWYRLYQAAPDLGQIVPHGDCHDRRSGHSVALYYKLASEYRIGEAQWLAEHVARELFWREAYESGVRPGVLPEAFLEMLWYDDSLAPRDPSDLPTSRHFPDLGLVVARSGWDPDATLLSFKASPGGGHTAWDQAHELENWNAFDASHHHPDSGSFVLISHGSFLAVDDGYCNLKQTANHNLVLVDGQGFTGDGLKDVYRDLPAGDQARVIHHVSGDGLVIAVADVTSMYPKSLELERMHRTVVFLPDGTVIVHDDLAAGTPHVWSWLLHSDQPAEVMGDQMLIRNGTGQLTVTMLTPARATQDTTKVFANPTGSTPSLEIHRTMHTVRWDSLPEASTRFLAVLQSDSALRPATQRPELLPARRGTVLTIAAHVVAFADGDGLIESDRLRAEALAVAASPSGLAAVEARSVVLDGAELFASGVQQRR